eukprot:592901-Karenia_brevis.AAC.1
MLLPAAAAAAADDDDDDDDKSKLSMHVTSARPTGNKCTHDDTQSCLHLPLQEARAVMYTSSLMGCNVTIATEC